MTTCSSNLLSQITGWVCTTSSTNHPTSVSSPTKTNTSSFFDIRGFVEESKSNDETHHNAVVSKYQHYVRNAFQCSGKDDVLLHCAPPRRGRGVDDATTMSDSHDDDDDADAYFEDEDEQYDYDQQMRRLASWGTFGTIGTTDSLDTNPMLMDPHNHNHNMMYTTDDDGRPIDPQIIEKAKQRNRAKLQQQQQQALAGDHKHALSTSTAPKKRSVKFAYPPITSLKQCPRIDPEELDVLFFSDEELATYEHDRRSTGVIDDVEIVAISTSFSDNENANTATAPSVSPEINSSDKEIPSTKQSHSTTISNHHAAATTTTPKSTFRFKSLMMASPRSLLRNSNQQPPTTTTIGPTTPKLKRRNSFGSSISSSLGKGNSNSHHHHHNSSVSSRCSGTDENSSSAPGTLPPTNDDPMANTTTTNNNSSSGTTPEPPKRLLKSVQIFLRERSTAYA